MRNIDIIRAWRDEEYRLSLTEAERASLPEHPAGLIELKDEQMGSVLGGSGHSCPTHNIFCFPTRYGTCTC
jgi:mersacidin/lichenicidin family type 2 lantibiotic